MAFVVQCERSAVAVGLQSPRGQQFWTGLWLLSDGEINRHPEMIDLLKAAGQESDDALEALLEVALDVAERAN